MRRRRLRHLAVLALCAGLLVEPARAVPRSLADDVFGPKMVRAEVIVQEGGAVRDLRVDRGRITAARPGGLRLVERDGTVVDVAVDASTRVTVNGRPAGLAELRRGSGNVTTVREGEGPALHVVKPPFALPRVLVQHLFGPRMVRAEVVLMDGSTVRDVRLDRGRIMQARAGTVRLRERDGTVVDLPVAPAAEITVNGRPARFAELRRGMSATIIREGDGAASVVQATDR
jgi:hypothetical protein